MKYLLVLAAVAAAAQAIGKWDEGLSVRFDIGLGVGRNFFIPVPQTLREAKNSRWVESPRPQGQPVPGLVLYNPSINDVVLGAFFDRNGNVAGIQIALPQDSYTDAYYEWEGQGFIEWTAPPNSKGVRRVYWTTAVYFVSEAGLAKSDEERAASRKGRVLQEDHVYVTGYQGELLPISTVASDIADSSTSYFTRQACIPFMGRHYYYNMTVLTECTTEGILSWFPLVDESSGSNQLIGVGFMNSGRLPANKLVRDYFERPTESNVKLIVNNAPQCLYDVARENGAVTMHIYFVNSPILINCLFT